MVALLQSWPGYVVAQDGQKVRADRQEVSGLPHTSHVHDGNAEREAIRNYLEQRFGGSGMMTAAATDDPPGRCLLPYYQMYEEVGESLSLQARENLEQMLAAPAESENVNTHMSPSGKFRITYTTSGPDSIPAVDSNNSGVPDYVEWTADYADSSYRYQVETLGFIDPTVHQGQECGNRTGEWQDTVITISYHNDSEFYGAFSPSSPFAFLVHRNFTGFPPNADSSHVQGALKVTIAHELKHVIQYATNCMPSGTGRNSWREMDATMMENIVYPDVNDYYNYIDHISSIFNSPNTSIPANVSASYGHVTWSLFFAEQYGMQFWVNVWDRLHNNHSLPFLNAINGELIEQWGESFESTLIRNHLWHLSSGSRSLSGYGFSEREYYPESQVVADFGLLPALPWQMVEVPLRAARYYEFNAEEINETGPVALTIFHDSLDAGVGVVAKLKNGDTREVIIPSSGTKPQKMVLPIQWEDIDWMGLVSVNSFHQQALKTQLFAGAGEDVERLVYGDITKSHELTEQDGLHILYNRLGANTFSPYERYIGDVTGSNRIGVFDAAWIYRVLDDDEAVFPVDDNEDGLGPEWSRFVQIDLNESTLFPAAQKEVVVHGPDTVSAALRMTTNQAVETQEMDLVMAIPGASDSTWYSLYLEIALDYPPNQGGGSGDFIELDVVDFIAEQEGTSLQGWVYEQSENMLKLAYASSAPFYSVSNPDDMFTLRLIPKNHGNIHFEIVALEIDERNYAFTHPPMDTIHIMGPVDAQPPDEQPVAFALGQNYPNPFNPETTITFALPETAPVRLQVYDVTGRLIATLIDETMSQGRHSVRFDARSHQAISSGVYLYRLEAGGQATVRKMTVIK